MTKLYRYRPLSELLFKELYYQELYLASYNELNDPLDLTASINFTPRKLSHVGYLIWFMYKTSIRQLISDSISERDRKTLTQLTMLYENEQLRKTFQLEIFKKVCDLKKKIKVFSFDSLETIITQTATENKIDFPTDFSLFRNELKRLIRVFIENSRTVCFSERNDNFLMWSHYSSKHSGICLEFSLPKTGFFPYENNPPRKKNIEAYEKSYSRLDNKIFLYWDRIHKVIYRNKQASINFFDFAAVFENEDENDLKELTKSIWQQYADKLKMKFRAKTTPWAYEKEWRAIDVLFVKPQNPEENIRHYPIEALSAIYFGSKTPPNIRKRIAAIYQRKHTELKFYESILTNGEMHFIEWEDDEAL